MICLERVLYLSYYHEHDNIRFAAIIKYNDVHVKVRLGGSDLKHCPKIYLIYVQSNKSTMKSFII